MSHKIAPSVLACDFANIQSESEMLNKSEADWFHIDIMDGVFVPNISFGLPVLKAFQKHATKPLDVHVMIAELDPYISDFKKAGAHILTVHIEACTHVHRTIQAIKEEGMLAGVALNPGTPVSVPASGHATGCSDRTRTPAPPLRSSAATSATGASTAAGSRRGADSDRSPVCPGRFHTFVPVPGNGGTSPGVC